MSNDVLDTELDTESGFDRRSFIKRAAVVGAATAWAAPTVQSLASPAFATGSPMVNECTGCLTGGGRYEPATYDGAGIDKVTFGLTALCCGSTHSEIQVNAHGTVDGTIQWHFKDNFVMACSFQAPDPDNPKACNNKFVGSADDLTHPTAPARLEFTFIDHGEPGSDVDFASITIKDIDTGSVLIAENSLTHGNLQAHESLGPVKRDCVACE